MGRPKVNVSITGGSHDPLNPTKNLVELTEEVAALSASIDRHSKVRPALSSENIGYTMFDEVLGKPIWWNGTQWVDAAGEPVDNEQEPTVDNEQIE